MPMHSIKRYVVLLPLVATLAACADVQEPVSAEEREEEAVGSIAEQLLAIDNAPSQWINQNWCKSSGKVADFDDGIGWNCVNPNGTGKNYLGKEERDALCRKFTGDLGADSVGQSRQNGIDCRYTLPPKPDACIELAGSCPQIGFPAFCCTISQFPTSKRHFVRDQSLCGLYKKYEPTCK